MSKANAKLANPEEVVAKIPPAAVRAICEEDPSLRALAAALDSLKLKKKGSEGSEGNKENDVATGNKKSKATTRSKSEEGKKEKLSGFEARRRVVYEIERGAVRLLCEKMTQPLLAEAVTSLGIKCGEGNNPSSRAVLTKRLSEHISTALGGVGLAAFLEKDASDDLISELAEVVPGLSESETEVSVEEIQAALEQEALVAFFESLREEQLHDICFAMKNEHPKGETRSRQVLAASIITDRPVSEIVAETEGESRKKEESKKKKVKLSKTKPKLREGVTYEDVFQWYYLAELQDYAREQGLKVSGTKKELILRVLAFLADPDAARAQAAAPARRKKAKKSKKTKKAKKVTKPEGGEEEKVEEENNEEAASGDEEDQDEVDEEEENVKGKTSKPSEEADEEEEEEEEDEGEGEGEEEGGDEEELDE